MVAPLRIPNGFIAKKEFISVTMTSYMCFEKKWINLPV